MAVPPVPSPRRRLIRAWPAIPDYDTLPKQWRRGVGLAIVFVLCALVEFAYVASPPVPDTPRGLDLAFAVTFLALAAISLVLVPRTGKWLLNALLATAWILVVVVTATRPTAAGQIAVGALLLVISLYAAYYTKGAWFGFHIAGMAVSYAVVRLAHGGPGAVFFTVFTVAMVVSVATLFHRLKSIDRRYQLLVENGADVVVMGCDGAIEWISPTVTRMLGWRPEELLGDSSDRLWHPDDASSAADLRERAYGGEPSTGVLRARHKDGHYVWIEYNAKPQRIRGRDGSIENWRDVTARVTAERELRRRERLEREQSQRQAQVAEAKANLFQNISHELRTPLAIINGPLHDLRHHAGLTAAERANIEAAVRAGARLERLVDGLLAIAQGQADRLGNVTEPTDLAAITRGTTTMFTDMAVNEGLDLVSSIQGVPQRVLIDPEAWITIMVNLISNALKYTEVGSVRVSLDYADNTAHLSVSDTGVGIPRSDLPRVFDRYEQAPNRPVHGPSGSGIGLALVAQLLRAMGGRSTITSEEGIGTTFEVWIPAPACPADAPVDSAHHLDVAYRQHAWAWTPPEGVVATEAAEVLDTADVHRGRILVVEDNADLRAYLVRLLQHDGWDVTAVADAETALPVVSAADLLLCDVMLPGASGIDVVRRVREGDDDGRWLPIILLTARAEDEAVLEGLTAGADDYVTKPFSPQELLARVGTHVELSFLRQIVLDQAIGRAANLEKALGSNRTIGTALGIIMATERVSADEAFTRLRVASQHANRKLRDVADDVIYTGAIP